MTSRRVYSGTTMTYAYSIGYGSREAKEVLDLVEGLGVHYLLDVRSSPYSAYSPAFNREALERMCEARDIKYVFVGDQLGGIPQSDTCYDSSGRVDYDRLAEEPNFVEGLEGLETALARAISFVLLCSELRPEQCHRSKLIGRALEKRGIQLRHIDADGSVVDQTTVIDRITGGQTSLFGETPEVSRSRGSNRSARGRR